MWQPTANIENLRARAIIIAKIRQFFAERGVLEVETPLLSYATVTDPHVHGIPAICKTQTQEEIHFLQTSPEYAMKRLLAADSGSIYQICKAFRQGDLGKLHNPEFTMLEWYRIDYDHHDLMDEMDELLQLTLQTEKADRISYAELFEKYLQINPHITDLSELQQCAKENINFTGELSDQNAWLDLLFTHCIEPNIGRERPLFLYDFPVSQAALARIRTTNPPVASRFEVYFKGIELANGFHELQDVKEQRQRFEKDLVFRKQNNLSQTPIDENFLAALEYGLPNCSGVALGLDRLIMLALAAKTIAEVMSFVTVMPAKAGIQS